MKRPSGVARVVGFMVVTCTMLAFTGSGAHAEARFVDLHGSVLLGGMTGRGSKSQVPDMFHQTEGLGLGAELGVRLLVLDLSLRFQQMFDTGGTGGTLLSALFGPSVAIPIRRLDGGLPKFVLHPSLVGGVVFGTGAPVSPPLNNDQLAGKGLLVMGRFGAERMFGPILGVGAEVEAGYHYLLGASGAVNGTDRSQGWQLGLFATASFHLGI